MDTYFKNVPFYKSHIKKDNFIIDKDTFNNLIKNILSEANMPFYIVDNDIKYDFLKEINPPGVGAESTGVVTRFTIDNPSPYSDFPIKIKLLTAKDLLIIFFDSFYLDQKRIKKFPRNVRN